MLRYIADLFTGNSIAQVEAVAEALRLAIRNNDRVALMQAHEQVKSLYH